MRTANAWCPSRWVRYLTNAWPIAICKSTPDSWMQKINE